MRWSITKTLAAAALVVALAGFREFSSMGVGATSGVQSPQSSPQASPPLASPVPSPSSLPAKATPSANNGLPGSHPFFVMIDPGHGGDDQGATLSGKIVEKDITLAFGRKLKAELHERGIPSRLTRDYDTTLSLEQRAETANEQHAAIYVALHAGVPGHGVRVYSPALPSPPAATTKFLPWDSAQAESLPRSRELAQKIVSELDKRSVATDNLSTPLRPLNNVVAPAVAVELAAVPDDLQGSKAQKFQTSVASAVAAAIAQVRPQLEGQQ